MKHRHTLRPLVQDGPYSVEYCETCDIVHVDVGPVTLRLRPGALDALARSLSAASMELHRAERDEQTLRLLPPTPLIN